MRRTGAHRSRGSFLLTHVIRDPNRDMHMTQTEERHRRERRDPARL
jgi:hypothetical protein